ncbi:MAG: hypothetical protein Q9183_003125, partial [Haloplaca sp. 2 TL-2023]
AMFDILEADIVIFQETKIQRKDLVDDMVLIPGWDCYWSLPKHKKGYSGVVIYTRQSVCAPIRAEEGITGILCPPNSSTSFAEGPENQQIGGYPTKSQLEASAIDATTLDSEGRCVILEFPAFVLLGVYSPANRGETRDDFRLGFLDILDARVRNLVAMGKRVFLAGDLNISREDLDTANAEAAMRKNGFTAEDYISTPSRRMFNQLLEDGKVIGERDASREEPIMWDICRGFHPGRRGMFTCWEQKVNARPGNYGARIDYVLCGLAMKSWFSDSNIQEGLMGSDHCPVYAVMNDRIHVDGKEVHTLDVMNPTGMFVEGERLREHAAKDMLPLSGKLIPEFDGRRNIRDMFARKVSIPKAQSIASPVPSQVSKDTKSAIASSSSTAKSSPGSTVTDGFSNGQIVQGNAPSANSNKRSLADTSTNKPPKRSKSGSTAPVPAAAKKGQQSLRGFFQAANPAKAPFGAPSAIAEEDPPDATPRPVDLNATPPQSQRSETTSLLPTSPASPLVHGTPGSNGARSDQASPVKMGSEAQDSDSVHDPIESKESWSKLFTKPAAPRCEGHEEPCKTMLTKKSGMNCGRSFWMCARPLGPSGDKEKGTQWRCHTFIWCSDWNPSTSIA